MRTSCCDSSEDNLTEDKQKSHLAVALRTCRGPRLERLDLLKDEVDLSLGRLVGVVASAETCASQEKRKKKEGDLARSLIYEKVFLKLFGQSRGNTVIRSELGGVGGREGSARFDVSPRGTHTFITADH